MQKTNSVKTRSKEDNFKGNTKATQFTSKSQPPKENQQRGMAERTKKLAIRDAIKIWMDAPYKFGADSLLKAQLEKSFGDISKATVKDLMILMQQNKSILEGDTQAFNALVNQGYGLPNQPTEITGSEVVIKISKHK